MKNKRCLNIETCPAHQPCQIAYADLEEAGKVFEAKESRSRVYKISSVLIKELWQTWNPVDLASSLEILLLSWNKAFYRYNTLDLQSLANVLADNQMALKAYRLRSIMDLKNCEEEKNKLFELFKSFSLALSIKKKDTNIRSTVSVVKALHLLAPDFFPLWDKAIAETLGFRYANNPAEKYWEFCLEMQSVIKQLGDYKAEIIPDNNNDKTILKKLDEYYYCLYTKNWIECVGGAIVLVQPAINPIK